MFEVSYHPDVLSRDVRKLNRNILERLQKAIENRLTGAPHLYGKPLRGSLKSLWSLRVGDFHVIYRLSGERVLVLQIVDRRDAYETGLLEARSLGWF